MNKTVKILLAIFVLTSVTLSVEAKKKKAKPATEAQATETIESTAARATTASDPSADEVVAYLGGEPITRAELELAAKRDLMRLEQERYEILNGTLHRIAVDRRLQLAAKERGVTAEELIKVEVEDKISDPTDDEIQQFFNQNRARIGERTLEEIKPAIVNELQRRGLEARNSEFIAALMEGNELRVLLDPPRVKVPTPEGEPSRGPENAPVTIVEFSDFQCGYCRRAHATVERLLTEFGDRIRFVYRDYALPTHARAQFAAEAARCAGEQGKYWEFHSELMQNQGSMTDADLKQRATTLGLEAEAFNECYDSRRHSDSVRLGFEDGNKAGVSGTPTFFVNGRMLAGARTFEELKGIVESEIERGSMVK